MKGKVIDTYLTCIASRSLKTMMKTTSIQKEVRISPKHIIENKTDKTLYISQDGSDGVLELQIEERKVLYFFVKDNKRIRVKSGESEESCNLEVDNYGVVNYYVSAGSKKRDNYRMNVSSVQNYNYIVFESLEDKNIPYRIRNNVKGLKAKASIIEGSLGYGEEVAFLWMDPTSPHVFKLELSHDEGGGKV